MPRITQTPYCVLVMSLLIGGGLFVAWLSRSPAERRSADDSQQLLDVSASTTRWWESEAGKLETLANQKHSVIPEGLSVYTLIDAGWTPVSDLIQLQGNAHELKTVLWARGVRGVCFEGRTLSQTDIDELALIRTLETVQFLKCTVSDGLDWTPLRRCSSRLITWGQGTISDRQFEALLDNLPPDIVALRIGFSPIQDSMISHLRPYTKLEAVDLVGPNSLTEIGFRQLCQQPGLLQVRIGCQITLSQYQQMRRERPDLDVGSACDY